MKKTACIGLMIAILLVGLGYGASYAGEGSHQDPLIDKLIEKGVITHDEGKAIKEEAETSGRYSREKEDTYLSLLKGLKGVSVGMLAYIDYSSGVEPEHGDDESSYNEFRLTRGYFTVKKELFPWLHTRVTIDAHQDETGDYKNRLKYLYAELRPPDMGFLTDMRSEIGLGHIPWLDFEEHVNPYRCQGTMAIERAGTFNSADTGVSLRGYFGGKLKDAKEKTGSHHYDGQYGSWHLGVYNGSGYHASEENNNKAVEGRLTVRPLPEVIPGLQLSYFGICGEGNKEAINGDYPDYNVNLGMVTYEHPRATITAQYFQTKGNAKGSWVDPVTGDALDTAGYSFFGKVKLPVLDEKLSLFARYDHFDQDDDDRIADDTAYDMFMSGLAYDVYKGNLLMLVYETTDYEDNAGKKTKVPEADSTLGDDHRIQAVWQIKF
jgi:hypothetical protein